MNILITGGTHGIGLAITKSFYPDNTVMVVARKTPAEFLKGISIIEADCTTTEGIDKICDYIEDNADFITFDILINNVGGGGRWGRDNVLKTEELIWEEVWRKNYEVARALTLTVLPYMKMNNFGRVVTISSIYGKESGGRPWFTVAKAAEIALMKSFAIQKDLVRHNITFNTVCPGAVHIPGTGWDNMSLGEKKEFEETLPLGRMGTPTEVANVVKFLCSKEASLVNGACIAVDGGESRSF